MKMKVRLFVFVLVGIFALSTQAFGYEEDTHFIMTYVICRSVGFAPHEALIVAAVDQGMDDSSGVVANTGPGGLVPQVTEEWMWHALDLDGKMLAKGIIARRNELYQAALGETTPYKKLIRLGVFFHYQQDTWGHRRHYEDNHLSRDGYTTYSTPKGHALDVHQPDRPPFDPVAALMNLEDGIGFARNFLKNGLGREPNPFLANYQPIGGKVDPNWKDEGKLFNQIDTSGAAPNSAREYLLSLIRAQIDTYESSTDVLFGGRQTSKEADLDKVRAALEALCNKYAPYGLVTPDYPAIVIPGKAQKLAQGFDNFNTDDLKGEMAFRGIVTNGMRVRDRSNGHIYLAIDGQLRLVPKEAYKNLFHEAGVIEVPKAGTNPTGDSSLAIGRDLSSGAYLVKEAASQQKYLVNDNQKRPITSQAFDSYDFNLSTVRTVTPAQLKAIQNGPEINADAAPFYPEEGMRFQDRSDGNYYLVIDGKLRRLVPKAYQNIYPGGGGFNSIAALKGFNVFGPPLSDNIYLAKDASDPKIYLITNGTKRRIISPAAFKIYGFAANAIRCVSQQQLAGIPNGWPIP